ncbi:hypothetical protein [Falsirhodobacter xinxiangensis]|uniref:hypothetical protein n=1 Tax=Falsirhodobacter xinxiangensis TaxID=2530049 RepID=UPI00145AF27E|nr:hypothetical protein [Rhodobacter xinxiangensis]
MRDQIEARPAGKGNTPYWDSLTTTKASHQQVLLRVFLISSLYSTQWLKKNQA